MGKIFHFSKHFAVILLRIVNKATAHACIAEPDTAAQFLVCRRIAVPMFNDSVSFVVEVMARRYHGATGEELHCRRETGNP